MDGELGLLSRTVSLDEASANRLERLCEEIGGSPDAVLQEALQVLEAMLDEERAPPHVWADQDVADFEEAKAEFARGGGIPHEQVMAEAREMIGEAEPQFTPEQIAQIERGLEAMREGRVKPSSEVFARLEAKYGG